MSKIFPDICLITPDPEKFSSLDLFLSQLVKPLSHGIRLVQLHSNMIDQDKYQIIAWGVKLLCISYDALLILNGPVSEETLNFCDGLHIDSEELLTLKKRPIKQDKLLSATCCDINQVRHAEKIQVDLITLPASKLIINDANLFWHDVSKLAFLTNIPIFVFGDMSASDLVVAKNYGAYGIAGINDFWHLDIQIDQTSKKLFH